MASGAVWGIDVGQCALKALRCRADDDPKKSSPMRSTTSSIRRFSASPAPSPSNLIGDALKQFLSRNTVLGDRVAVSVSGQAGLARFIKLPPVEAKKIPDIVRYEARQQIPFDLNDVIWDYQRIGVGAMEEGFALETEIGLFAMKRDAVFRALDPFLQARHASRHRPAFARWSCTTSCCSTSWTTCRRPTNTTRRIRRNRWSSFPWVRMPRTW